VLTKLDSTLPSFFKRSTTFTKFVNCTLPPALPEGKRSSQTTRLGKSESLNLDKTPEGFVTRKL
jgi:hypothetical protein